ncbi:hypothetical protein GI584_17125 [Gracilibacillus salitolerans]|uniref:Uncharacterized protein n=1 Tax=Gracilibacillus salitolerans TaxID=2663022 RepID=A0A5Q2TNJ5_9BACI|nr:hypothetical protein [Gracilibacillus salitolerans]QGH35667.1 hypothetical protein GI584_17125 [Gracilibacillus salitolerans]
MSEIQSVKELMKCISDMDSENSVLQFTIPGKGKFTLVLQEEERSIKSEADENPELEQMLKESKQQYKDGRGMTTKELLKSFSKEDFKK